MLADFLFSIAGKKTHVKIDAMIDSILATEALQPSEQLVFNHIKKCSEYGNYPSSEYFSTMGYEAFSPTNSLSEITVLFNNTKDFLLKEKITRGAFKSINTSSSYKELVDALSKLSSEDVTSDDLEVSLFSAEITSVEEIVASEHSYKLGISDIDTLTGGCQPGTVATLAAFTGCGKSTLLVSSSFKNIKEGRKGVYFSLEVSPSVVKLQFFSRYCYEEQNFPVTPKDIMDGSLTDEDAAKVVDLLPKFNEFIRKKLLIVDESFLSKDKITDFKLLSKLYAKFDAFLGGLDFVGYDHINQIDLMFKDLGNIAVRTITSAGKTFISKSGKPPATLLCCQVNRDGYKRACKRNGKYDIVAIGDLNEVERSSVYIIFMHSTDELKLLQEARVSMLKHRYGACLSEPVATNFNPASFFVGEEIETVQFDGDFSFLKNTAVETKGDEFDEF